MNSLFTIGHSNHEVEAFIDLLMQHRIDALADVRSQPYSRHYPQFNRETLMASLKEAGIRYVFLGEELGARRDERECYIGGKVSYDRISETPAFLRGLDRLQQGLERFRISLMCAEKDPLDCHRTILVARQAVTFAEVIHIRYDGSLESHAEAEARLLQRCGVDPKAGDLFRSREELLADAYKRRGDEIAYVEALPSQPVDQ